MSADGGPALSGNDSALGLLRDLAIEVRGLSGHVADVRVQLGKIDGQELVKRLNAHAERFGAVEARLADVEAGRRADLAQRKPWVFIAGELVKLVIAAVLGAGAALFAAHH